MRGEGGGGVVSGIRGRGLEKKSLVFCEFSSTCQTRRGGERNGKKEGRSSRDEAPDVTEKNSLVFF